MTSFERLRAETSAAQRYILSAPIIEDVMTGRFDLETYVRFLTNAYHHVRHTVPFMMACGARLPERLRWLLPQLRDYIVEEIGHDQWILDDLAACGVPHAVSMASTPDHSVEVMVAYVYDYINRVNPVGFLGMVHVLEGTSTALATETARRAQLKLGLPDAAFTNLRSHGELDQEHVLFFQHLIDRLDEQEDLDAVIHVANQVYRLYGNVLGAAATATAPPERMHAA